MATYELPAFQLQLGFAPGRSTKLKAKGKRKAPQIAALWQESSPNRAPTNEPRSARGLTLREGPLAAASPQTPWLRGEQTPRFDLLNSRSSDALRLSSSGRTGRFHHTVTCSLKRRIKRTKTPWLSAHLCWGSVDGRYTHDLLPIAYTFGVARHTAQKVREARDFLEVPICVENVSTYAEYNASKMTEWEFLSEVVELADCGILVDVNNIYLSSKNHNFDAYH